MLGRRRVGWLVAAVAPTVVVVEGWANRWMSDDGFIHLRVVQQLVGGNGPVYNVGERIEASTSPLWVALLALAHPIPGLSLPWTAVVLGIALTALGIVAAQAAGWALARPPAASASEPGSDPGREQQVILPVGALVVAALPPFWDFASSGLETGMTFAWIGASCWWCARRVTAPSPPGIRAELAGAGLVGVGWLVRPDLAIFTVAFGVVLAVALWPASRRRKLAALAAAAALPLAYQVFRMGFYAMVIPNTALAKEAGRPQWGQGWRYLQNLMSPYWLWLPLAVLAAVLVHQLMADVGAGARARALARAAPAVAGVLHGLYVLRVGGDFMHARLLLPAVFGLLAPVVVVMPRLRAGDRRTAAWPVAAVTVVAVVAVVAVWSVVSLVSPPGHGELDAGVIEDERALEQRIYQLEHPVNLHERVWGDESADGGGDRLWPRPERGRAQVISADLQDFADVPLSSELPIRTAAVPPAFGAGAYATDLDVYAVDMGSLAHPVGSHLDHLVGARPGHQKPVPLVWQVAGLTDVEEVRGIDGRVVVTSEDLAAARHARACGQLGRYLRGVREPLTVGRFVGNVWDSFANTLLRLPPDPVDAEADLCD